MTQRDVRSFCRICTAMCGIVVTVDDDRADGSTDGSTVGSTRVLQVRGDPDHPLSRGYTCPKGRALPQFHHHPRRLDRPRLQGTNCTGGPVDGDTSWDGLLDDLARRVRTAVDRGGPSTVAMYLASGSAFDTTGRRAAERFLTVLGCPRSTRPPRIDTPCKPLVAELVGGWSGLTPMLDHERCELLVLFGTNPVVSHGHSTGLADPVVRLREIQARGGEVWVVDPRRTETAALGLPPSARCGRAPTGWCRRTWCASWSPRRRRSTRTSRPTPSPPTWLASSRRSARSRSTSWPSTRAWPRRSWSTCWRPSRQRRTRRPGLARSPAPVCRWRGPPT